MRSRFNGLRCRLKPIEPHALCIPQRCMARYAETFRVCTCSHTFCTFADALHPNVIEMSLDYSCRPCQSGILRICPCARCQNRKFMISGLQLLRGIVYAPLRMNACAVAFMPRSYNRRHECGDRNHQFCATPTCRRRHLPRSPAQAALADTLVSN